MDYEVLPYHWNDWEKLFRDFQKLDEIYENCLAQLADRLNQIHRLHFPPGIGD